MLSRPAPGAPIAAFDPQVLAWMQYQQHLQAQAQSTGTWVSRPAIVGSSAGALYYLYPVNIFLISNSPSFFIA
jgi:hypothetical protein